MLLQRLHERLSLVRLPQGLVVLLPLFLKIFGEVIVGIAVFVGTHDPQFTTAQPLAQGLKHTEFVVHAVDPLFPILVLLEHHLLPHRAHHPCERNILVHRVIDARCPSVALDQVQGTHDGLMHAIGRTHIQHVEQPRHHAPIVIAIGGAHLQVHLLLVATLGLVLLDNGFALLFADGGKDAGANGLFGMGKRGVGHLIQEAWLIIDPSHLVKELLADTLLRFGSNPMHDQQQEIHQTISHFRRALQAESSQIGVARGIRMTAQFVECFRGGTLPVEGDDVRRGFTEKISRKS